MDAMKKISSASDHRHLAFTDKDRTFTCLVAPRRPAESTLWWWFSVSGGNTARYAPFVAAPDDTDDSVRMRILTYYEDHLSRRMAPAGTPWRRAAS